MNKEVFILLNKEVFSEISWNGNGSFSYILLFSFILLVFFN